MCPVYSSILDCRRAQFSGQLLGEPARSESLTTDAPLYARALSGGADHCGLRSPRAFCVGPAGAYCVGKPGPDGASRTSANPDKKITEDYAPVFRYPGSQGRRRRLSEDESEVRTGCIGDQQG